MRASHFLILGLFGSIAVAACSGDKSSSSDTSDGWSSTSDNGWSTGDDWGSTGGWSGSESVGFQDGDGWNGGPVTDTSPVVLAATPPRPVNGGAMIAAADGALVASDSERDAITWTSTDGNGDPFAARLAFTKGDDPGRLAEDAAGFVHVVLRGSGAIATVDRTSSAIVRRTPVCAAPRGVAYDADRDDLVVTCVDGSFVTLAAADDTLVSSAKLVDDLRDVVVLGGGYFAVSRLRTAELLVVDATGAVQSTSSPKSTGDREPDVAWKIAAVPDRPGVVFMTHQLASTGVIDLTQNDGWSGSGQPGVVTSAATVFHFDLGSPASPPFITTTELDQGPLPLDVAFDASGYAFIPFFGAGIVFRYAVDSAGALTLAGPALDGAIEGVAFDGARVAGFDRFAAGFLPTDGTPSITPAGAIADLHDTGASLFETASSPSGTLACESCHPEGRDDGRVWSFNPLGLRKTPSLVGGVLATAPFHWQGELADIPALVDDVYTGRMGGMIEDLDHAQALARFLDAIPRVPLAPVAPTDSITHGQALFQSADVGCTACHTGDHFTSNATVDVGTGGMFQVPTLVGVSQRGPWIHDGCAKTLFDRFDPSCGGGDNHGQTSQLSADDIADLVAYLETL